MSEEASEICLLAEDDFASNGLTLTSEDDSSWIDSVDMNQWKSHFKFNELLVEAIIADLLSDKFPSRQPKDETLSFEYQKYLHIMEPVSGIEKSCYPNLPGTELQFGMVQIAYTLPYIEEDNDLFERFFSLLPGGPTKTPLHVTSTDQIITHTTQDNNTEEDNAISRELKLQKKITSLQAQRGSLDKGAIRERRRMKKQEKKLQAKKKALSGKKEKSPKDPELKIKKNSPKHPAESTDQLLFGGITTESQLKKKRKTITGLHGKNYKQLLSKVEKKEEEIKKLEAVDQEAAREAVQEKKWKAALDRASGQKVKDNPELLKKALKRKEKLKEKRKKAWDERTENVEEKLKRKQARRERNIQTRKDSKKQTKLKKALKKGRVFPTKS